MAKIIPISDPGSVFAGISTRQVGRVLGPLTGETVSAQTVSKLTRDLNEAV